MQNCIHDCPDYYAKSFVFVQSSKIGKSRLTNTFGKSCPMINFILCKDDGHPFGDTKILQFIFLEPSNKVKESITILP